MSGELAVTLVAPGEVRYDLTPVLDAGQASEITEQLEDDFTAATYGDFDLRIADDRAGTWRALLDSGTETEEWRIEIERLTDARRAKWERLWLGLLDLPRSYEIDVRARQLAVHAFSAAKVLERTSAEGVRRFTVPLLADVNSGTASVVLVQGTTADLRVDDEIEIGDGTNSETKTIATITSTTALTANSNYANTYNDAPLTLLSFFHRRRSLDFLAGELFDKAGISVRTIDLKQDGEFASAVVMPGNEQGLATAGTVRSLMGRVTADRAEVVISGGAGSYRAPNLKDGWTSESPSAVAKIDYSGQQAAEPGTLIDAATSYGDRPALALTESRDDFRVADYLLGDYYQLQNSGVGASPLNLLKNGAFAVQLQASSGLAVYPGATLVADSIQHRILVYYSTSTTTFLKSWDGTTLVTLRTRTVGGAGAYAPYFGTMGFDYRLNIAAFLETDLSSSPARDRIYLLAPNLGPSIAAPGNVVHYLYTLRSFGGRACFIYSTLSPEPAYRLAMYDPTTLALVADVIVAQLAPPGTRDVFLTRLALGGVEMLVGFVGRTRCFVVAQSMAGVIPYAGFEGQSVAAALRELALAGIATAGLDEFGNGYLLARLRIKGSTDLDGQIMEQLARPLSPKNRTSVEFRGTDEAGDSFTVLTGKTGDSEHRLELSSSMVTNALLGAALGAAYSEFFSGHREEQIVVHGASRIYHADDRIEFDGRIWAITQATYRHATRDQELLLYEVG